MINQYYEVNAQQKRKVDKYYNRVCRPTDMKSMSVFFTRETSDCP
jgi:hypothetical protein